MEQISDSKVLDGLRNSHTFSVLSNIEQYGIPK